MQLAAQKQSYWLSLWRQISKNRKIVLSFIALVLLLFVLALIPPHNDSHRTETYKNATGAAGLDATITYNTPKPTFNFNVYIFNDDGQQVNVTRPDKNGRVRLAMAEGNYVMLIAKQFGKGKVFPQEQLVLKNGKSLDLKLQYKEG